MEEPIVLVDNPPIEATPKTEAERAPISILPERLEGETFEEYRARRTFVNKIIRQHIKRGVMFWDSSKKGTYKRNRQGV